MSKNKKKRQGQTKINVSKLRKPKIQCIKNQELLVPQVLWSTYDTHRVSEVNHKRGKMYWKLSRQYKHEAFAIQTMHSDQPIHDGSCKHLKWVWRYQRGNQNPYMEEEQTTQLPKEKVQKDKQRSTKHTYKTKDRVTRTPLKTGGEPRYKQFLLH